MQLLRLYDLPLWQLTQYNLRLDFRWLTWYVEILRFCSSSYTNGVMLDMLPHTRTRPLGRTSPTQPMPTSGLHNFPFATSAIVLPRHRLLQARVFRLEAYPRTRPAAYSLSLHFSTSRLVSQGFRGATKTACSWISRYPKERQEKKLPALH